MNVIRHELDRELQELHMDVLKMGSLIEESIDNMLLALVNQDVDLAKKVIEGDQRIDQLEQQIEAECITVIARQQPLAGDLRLITSILKMITDLERIADHCEDISEITIRLSTEEYYKPLTDIFKMGENVKLMVKNTIDSYVNKDVILARKVVQQDDVVDQLFEKIYAEIVAALPQQPKYTEQLLHFLMIIKYLERMADHSTNVCEWVIFTKTGQHQ